MKRYTTDTNMRMFCRLILFFQTEMIKTKNPLSAVAIQSGANHEKKKKHPKHHHHDVRDFVIAMVILGNTVCSTQYMKRSHYNDVIMTTIVFQITSLTVVYSTVYSDADQRKHQSSASLAFVWGTHRDQWIPRTKGQLRGKCSHLMTSSWIFKDSPHCGRRPERGQDICRHNCW